MRGDDERHTFWHNQLVMDDVDYVGSFTQKRVDIGVAIDQPVSSALNGTKCVSSVEMRVFAMWDCYYLQVFHL